MCYHEILKNFKYIFSFEQEGSASEILEANN